MAVLVLVVVRAESAQVPPRGRPALLERLVVVDLEVVGDVAPFDVTLPMELLHRGAQPRLCTNIRSESRPKSSGR
jgi:hypothetical protein